MIGGWTNPKEPDADELMDRIRELKRTPDRNTCGACHHEDWATELYVQAIPGGGAGTYCRNHNACRTREKANRARSKGPTTMEFGEYTAPVQTEGSDYKPRDHYGNHAIIRVLEYRPEVVTSNSPNGAPAIIGDVYDMNTKTANLDVLMMTGAIVDGLKPHVGKNPIVIQWEKQVARNGRDYARPVPASERAIEAAKAIYAAGDPFAPKVETIVESEPPY